MACTQMGARPNYVTREKMFAPTHQIHNDCTVSPYTNKVNANHQVNSKHNKQAQASVPQDHLLSNDNTSVIDDTVDLIQWHQRLNHLSFRKLKLVANLGILPRRLTNTKVPRCACCVFGTMTRQRWRNKKNPRNSERPRH